MPKPNERKQIGAVITFPEGTDMKRVKELLDHLSHNTKTIRIESYHADYYNPDYGSPVFYVP